MKGFSHPKGYYSLFTILTLERFSYYGMRTLLLMYMFTMLKLEKAYVDSFYWWFVNALMVAPVIGGIISDRMLGAKRSLVLACLSIAAADVVMLLSSISSSTIVFYTTFALLIIGGGLFRPSYYTMLGNLYEDRNDAHRDSGFTFTFLGTNIAALFSSLVCISIAHSVGYWLGFIVVGVSAFIAMLLSSKLKEAASNSSPVAVPVENRHKIYALLVISIFVLFFWSLLSQSSDAFNFVFINFTSVVIAKPPFAQSMIFILGIVLTPIFTWYWVWSSDNGKVRSTLSKFMWGMILATVSFAILYKLFLSYQKTGVVSLYLLILSNIIFVSGEMFIGPIANSLVTRLAPARYTGTLIGVWILLTGIGSFIGARFVPAYGESGRTVFIVPIIVAAGSVILIALLIRPLRKWMHGIN